MSPAMLQIQNAGARVPATEVEISASAIFFKKIKSYMESKSFF